MSSVAPQAVTVIITSAEVVIKAAKASLRKPSGCRMVISFHLRRVYFEGVHAPVFSSLAGRRLPLRVSRFHGDFCVIRLVWQRGKPALYKDAEGDTKGDITKRPHDACSKLLILQGGESTSPGGQLGIRSVEGVLSKSYQHCQNSV